MVRSLLSKAIPLGLVMGALSFATPSRGMNIVVDPGVNTSWAPGDWGQSFTAADGDIGSVGLLLWNSGAPTNVTLNLYDGAGTGGTLLKSQSLAVPNSSNGSWIDLGVSDQTFSASSMYTITMAGSVSAKTCFTNSYAGGDAYYGSGVVPGYDLSFRVSPVPEPSSLLLLGLGVVGLAGRRSLPRRR